MWKTSVVSNDMFSFDFIENVCRSTIFDMYGSLLDNSTFNIGKFLSKKTIGVSVGDKLTQTDCLWERTLSIFSIWHYWVSSMFFGTIQSLVCFFLSFCICGLRLLHSICRAVLSCSPGPQLATPSSEVKRRYRPSQCLALHSKASVVSSGLSRGTLMQDKLHPQTFV